jgi:8-oxo-dGTP pyrophosphatase MutT (NUDIX family)
VPHTYDASLIDRLRELLRDRQPRQWHEEGRRPAAVLIPLFVRNGEVHVVLTRKTEHLRRHHGQISFPGGGWDPQDPSLEHTALREAEEEVAIRPDDVEILGVMDDLPTATTNYVVRPFVAVIPHPYAFVPNAFEVARVFTVPLAAFAREEHRREEIWERGGRSFPMAFYDVDGETVWGVTERLLSALIALVEGREPDYER